MIESWHEAYANYSPVGQWAHGMVICMLGIDGAGKSTQAHRLVARLRSAGYDAAYVWAGRRATITAPLVRLGKAQLRAPARPQASSAAANVSYRSYVASAQTMFRQTLVRAAWRNLTVAEHVVQLWQCVGIPMLRGTIVVCDRYVYDTWINHAVLFAGTSLDAAHRLKLVPRPSLGFWIDVSPDLALRRKADVYDLQQLAARAPFYASLAATLGLQRLDGTASADTIADTIWWAVLRHLSSRASGSHLERPQM